jgi:DNA-directed RNA polymerase specialized sigma24 family protein
MSPVDLILKIASELAGRHTFPNYDREDVEQEAAIFGLEALKRYDGVRPLENFLRVHMRNRLSNLRRDKYYRPDTGRGEEIQQGKRRLLDAGSFDGIEEYLSTIDQNAVENREILDFIDSRLPKVMRSSYLRYMVGGRITKSNKIKLLVILREILEEYSREDG